MKKIILISIAAVVVLVFVLVFVLLFSSRGTASTTASSTPISFPTANSDGSPAATSSMHTSNFLAAPDVKEDANNPGYYYLGNQPPGGNGIAAPYLIEYIAETHYFNISLTKEPIGENRRAAEQYLLQKLNLTQKEMCALSYTVSVPNDVNGQFTGMNLGFSFCPGAVKLP